MANLRFAIMAASKKKTVVRRKGFVALNFQSTVTLSTLANGASLTANAFGTSFTRDLFGISVDAQLTLRNITPGEGPITVGFAHSNLTDTEIAEALTISSQSDLGDQTARERGRRPVRRAGTFPCIAADEVVNNGNPVRTTLKFSLHQSHNLDFFAHNHSGAVLTTGGVVEALGVLFARRM